MITTLPGVGLIGIIKSVYCGEACFVLSSSLAMLAVKNIEQPLQQKGSSNTAL